MTNAEKREAYRPLFLDCFENFVNSLKENNDKEVKRLLAQFGFLLGAVQHDTGVTTPTAEELSKVHHWMRYEAALEEGTGDCTDETSARMLIMRAWSWGMPAGGNS
jgi:hypothetical protein